MTGIPPPNSDRLTALANNAVVSLASRAALGVVLTFTAFFIHRSLGVLDRLDAEFRGIAQNMAVVSNELGEHSRRLDRVEGRVFR